MLSEITLLDAGLKRKCFERNSFLKGAGAEIKIGKPFYMYSAIIHVVLLFMDKTSNGSSSFLNTRNSI